ncbi:MAG: phosphatase PAP2 family protein [Acidobacteria bacterium]|nr:phosphatase PAP2 family protein [Acidobacteriota bacterium]
MQVAATRTVPWAQAVCRPSERLILGYFLYMAALATVWKISGIRLFGAWAFPPLLFLACAWETRAGNRWTSMLRDWLPLSLILAGYYLLDLITGAPIVSLQEMFIQFDRILLNNLGLQAAVEWLGPVIPWVLELVYLLLYAIPPVAMAVIYLCGKRSEAGRFLLVFFAGTFATYAVLPHFPTLAPRVAFPDVAPPGYTPIWRTVNLFNLTNLDISTSVFPSGHVAVAFSAAFGLWEVLSHRKLLCAAFFGVAVTVYIATVYCRYHYAADGAASIAIASTVWWISHHLASQTTPSSKA